MLQPLLLLLPLMLALPLQLLLRHLLRLSERILLRLSEGILLWLLLALLILRQRVALLMALMLLGCSRRVRGSLGSRVRASGCVRATRPHFLVARSAARRRRRLQEGIVPRPLSRRRSGRGSFGSRRRGAGAGELCRRTGCRTPRGWIKARPGIGS